MPDKKQVMFDIERCICHVPDACRDCSKYKGVDGLRCMEELMADAYTLLKEQETDIGNLNETVKDLLNAYTEIKAIYGDSVRVVGELVRCKDCKHHGKGTCGAVAGIAFPPPDDWYCADGEREEGR